MSGLRCFFASPFAQEFTWIRNAVARACREHSLEFRAVDETVLPGEDIVSRVHQEIEEADVGIAVVSGYNPNVMYELGRLHQASKPTIILIEGGAMKQMPFDIRGFAAIEYNPIARAESDLAAVVGSALVKLKEALTIQGRQLMIAREGRTPPRPRRGGRSYVASMLAFEFEDLRKEAERRMGKNGCVTIDIQAKDVGSFKGWHQTLRCPCGDDLLVVVDLNGQIVRTRIL